MSKYYGEKVSPILKEIADTLWEIDARDHGKQEPYEYAEGALASALKIFMSVAMDKLWHNQEATNMSFEDRLKQAESLGLALRKLCKDQLNVDSTKLY